MLSFRLHSVCQLTFIQYVFEMFVWVSVYVRTVLSAFAYLFSLPNSSIHIWRFFLLTFFSLSMRCIRFLFSILAYLNHLDSFNILKLMLILFSPYLYHLNVHVVLIVYIVCVFLLSSSILTYCSVIRYHCWWVHVSIAINVTFIFIIVSSKYFFCTLFLSVFSFHNSVFNFFYVFVCVCPFSGSQFTSFFFSNQARKTKKTTCYAKDWCQK